MNVLVTVLNELATGIAAGSLSFGFVGLSRGLGRLGPRAYVEARQALNRTDDPYMPIVVTIAGVTNIAALLSAATVSHATAAAVLLLAIVALVVVAVTSVRVNVPINRIIATWDPQKPPADWMAVRRRWHRAHALRATMGLIAFIAAVASSKI